LEPGEALFREGDRADVMFAVLAGDFEVRLPLEGAPAS
jgi:CRP-like cAMP-binding protein